MVPAANKEHLIAKKPSSADIISPIVTASSDASKTIETKLKEAMGPVSRFQSAAVTALVRIDDSKHQTTGCETSELAISSAEVHEILCVEDDKVQQAVIKKLVSKNGFRVTAVESGEQALELLAARHAEGCGHGTFPDIILMDVMLPGMSGCETTEVIRRKYPDVPLPIIMVTGCDTSKEVLQTFIACGANDVVEKPHVEGCLLARVSAQLTLLHFWRGKLAAQKNESLLKEILPGSVIDRLAGPAGSRKLIFDEHEEVSIVFTDIVGYTELASSVATRDLIEMLDILFSAFDTLALKHGIYKVETIGDAYMLVGWAR